LVPGRLRNTGSGLADAKGVRHSRVCDNAREREHGSAAMGGLSELELLSVWRLEEHERVEGKVTSRATGARHLHVIDLLAANRL